MIFFFRKKKGKEFFYQRWKKNTQMALTTCFKQITWNLDMISSLGNNQTFYVVDTKLFIENRSISSMWRCQETRFLVLDAIEYTWKMTDEMLVSYQHTSFLQPHIFYESRKNNTTEEIKNQLNELTIREEKVLEGLNRLGTFSRYLSDSCFLVRISHICSEFKRLCVRANELQSKQLQLKKEVDEILNNHTEVE
jgi:hypothetical protein